MLVRMRFPTYLFHLELWALVRGLCSWACSFCWWGCWCRCRRRRGAAGSLSRGSRLCAIPARWAGRRARCRVTAWSFLALRGQRILRISSSTVPRRSCRPTRTRPSPRVAVAARPRPRLAAGRWSTTRRRSRTTTRTRATSGWCATRAVTRSTTAHYTSDYLVNIGSASYQQRALTYALATIQNPTPDFDGI